jgi:hypothetical protein
MRLALAEAPVRHPRAHRYRAHLAPVVRWSSAPATMPRLAVSQILFQFLQDVESQHFACREIVVDTHSVNISEEAEDVAALFHRKITPISAGTPQELAFAESAVRNLAKISKSMMNGAPHLPTWAWGLADGYATYVHDVLPQRSKGNRSPFEMRLKRKPELRRMFIKTFGAPLQYSPMEGPEHKRGKMTEWGWFAGLQGQMVVVIRKEDLKCINVSKKKIKVYEGSYAYFDPTTMKVPNGNPIEINDVLDVTDDEDLILDDEDNDHDEVGSSSQGESDESNLKSRMLNEPSAMLGGSPTHLAGSVTFLPSRCRPPHTRRIILVGTAS